MVAPHRRETGSPRGARRAATHPPPPSPSSPGDDALDLAEVTRALRMAQRDDTRAREAMSDAALADHAADLWRERGKRPDETMALREVMGVGWGCVGC
jgi:hypothetical protein